MNELRSLKCAMKFIERRTPATRTWFGKAAPNWKSNGNRTRKPHQAHHQSRRAGVNTLPERPGSFVHTLTAGPLWCGRSGHTRAWPNFKMVCRHQVRAWARKECAYAQRPLAVVGFCLPSAAAPKRGGSGGAPGGAGSRRRLGRLQPVWFRRRLLPHRRAARNSRASFWSVSLRARPGSRAAGQPRAAAGPRHRTTGPTGRCGVPPAYWGNGARGKFNLKARQ